MSALTVILRAFFGIYSFVTLLFLIRNIRRNRKSSNYANLLLKAVYFMTLSITMFTVAQLCFSLPLLFKLTTIWGDSEHGRFACIFITFLGNFAFSCSVLWYAHIAMVLAFLLYGYSRSWLKANISKHHVVVWILSCLLCLGGFLPFVITNQIRSYCWMSPDFHKKNIYSFFIYYAPILSTMVFSIGVLLVALYQLKNKKTILDISAFVACFILVWFVPSLHAVVDMLDYKFGWLDEGHYMSLSLAGILHFQIWIFLSQVSKKKIHKKGTQIVYTTTKMPIQSSQIISTLFSCPEQTHTFPESRQIDATDSEISNFASTFVQSKLEQPFIVTMQPASAIDNPISTSNTKHSLQPNSPGSSNQTSSR